MIRRDNRWTVRVTEWQLRDGNRRQGRQRIYGDMKLKVSLGGTWNRQASDRVEWKI